MTTDPLSEPCEPDNPAAYALARHIADHPVSTVQAAFRYLNAPLAIELHEDTAAVRMQSPPADWAALRDRIAAAIARRDGHDWGPGKDSLPSRVIERYTHLADAVLPPPADRAAVLREEADRIDEGWFTTAAAATAELRRMADETATTKTQPGCPTPETHNYGCGCPSDVAAAISSCPGYEMSPSPCRCPCYGCKHHCGAHNPESMADETPATEAQPRRGDAFERWLKARRDDHRDTGRGVWTTLDNLLDAYRLHADTRTPLDKHVCEGQAIGDCECLEQPAAAARQDGTAS